MASNVISIHYHHVELIQLLYFTLGKRPPKASHIPPDCTKMHFQFQIFLGTMPLSSPRWGRGCLQYQSAVFPSPYF